MLQWTGEALVIGGFELRFYGLLMALGVLSGVMLAHAREGRLELKRDTSVDLALVCVPAAIVGARLYYVALSWDMYRDSLWKIFSLREGGMAIYGGVLAGIVVGWIFCRARKLPFWKLADLAAPSVALGQAVGRWGNYINQEAYGRAVTDPKMQWFPLAVFIEREGQWQMATFFYESMWCFCIVALLLWGEGRRKFRRSGDMFLWYALLYGLGRFAIEGLRTDSLMLGPVRASQLVAAALALFSVAALFVRWPRRPLRF